MKKYKFTSALALTTVLMLFFNLYAFANSSWVWLTVKPYDVLPFGALLTLAIETMVIACFNKQSNIYKVLTGVFLGNLVSFALPYVGYAFGTPPYSGFEDLKLILNHGPFYTVGAFFLILTLLAEVPFIYFWLRKGTENKKKLIVTTLIANVVTTALVAIIERTLCKGHW